MQSPLTQSDNKTAYNDSTSFGDVLKSRLSISWCYNSKADTPSLLSRSSSTSGPVDPEEGEHLPLVVARALPDPAQYRVPDFVAKNSEKPPTNNVVDVVMPLRFFRGMPGRQVVVFVLLSIVAGFGYLHLITEISRLDIARSRLEKTVAQLQLDKLDNVQRHLASTSALEQSTSYDDDFLIIYNRVPKTGSTSFAGIAYDLCTRNKFHVLHLNITKNSHTLSLSDQMRFVYNITTWNEKKPALYHGHLAYIEFSKFGIQKKPIFINIIRKPLDRLVSYYYFVRHGDDFRPYLRRRKAGNKQTFDDCVEENGEDCDPSNLWMQIPFFCGHAAECWMPGYRWALEQAKYNLVHNYLVVGITEELGDFIAILEATLPRFFKGAVDLYNSGRKSHLRKTSNKIPPKESTLQKIQQSKIWKMEQEFYEFAVEQFHFIKQRTFDLVEGEYVEKGYQFVFEKIRPK